MKKIVNLESLKTFSANQPADVLLFSVHGALGSDNNDQSQYSDTSTSRDTSTAGDVSDSTDVSQVDDAV